MSLAASQIFSRTASDRRSYDSMAFLIYAFVVFLIHLYSTSGRNANTSPYDGSNGIALPATAGMDVPMEYELASRDSADGPANKWRTSPYARVPNAESGVRDDVDVVHVVGGDDDDEEDDDRQTLVASAGTRR